MENLTKEINKLEEEINNIKNNLSQKKRLEELRKQKKQLEFRQQHPTLLKFTVGAEQGIKRMFKATGRGLKKAGSALEKSDAYIAREKEKERQMSKTKSKPKSILEEAGLGVD